jgi:hypothetical protein
MASPYLVNYSEKPINTQELMTNVFTGPIFKGSTAEWWINMLCLTDTGDRDCGDGYDQDPYYLTIGWVPTEAINGRDYKTDMEPQINFWRDLIEGVYTKENVEAFWQTFDPDLLSLNQDNLPENFLIPARAD